MSLLGPNNRELNTQIILTIEIAPMTLGLNPSANNLNSGINKITCLREIILVDNSIIFIVYN